MATKTTSATAIFRIELHEIRPLIWRRVRVMRTMTFRQFHEVLQIVMGWRDLHLHEFQAGEMLLAMPDVEETDEEQNVQDENLWTLKELLDTGVAELEYAYDFGDGWLHRIILEPATRSRVAGPSPLCLAGENACPPEDVGGPLAYMRFLEAIADPRHEEYQSYLQWVGGIWDAKGFDLNRIKRDLRDWVNATVPSRPRRPAGC